MLSSALPVSTVTITEDAMMIAMSGVTLHSLVIIYSVLKLFIGFTNADLIL